MKNIRGKLQNHIRATDDRKTLKEMAKDRKQSLGGRAVSRVSGEKDSELVGEGREASWKKPIAWFSP